jgi:hypothetical protein
MIVEKFGFRSHMNLNDQGVRIDAGKIVCPENIIHGKDFMRIVRTPKKNGVWGKGVVAFCLGEDHSPEFDTLEAFKAHYKVESEIKVQ